MPQTGVRFTVDVDRQDAETFAVVSFHLVQSYSSLFTLDIHVASSNIRLNARDLLEQTAVLTIWQGSTPQRHIKGLTARLERGEYDGHIMHYHLRVHPPFWRSSLRQNFRHFQQQDIESIIQRLLDDNRVTDTSFLLGLAHPEREFCVQYGETDYEFLCRLLSEEGIFFYEEHAREGTNQLLIFADKAFYLPEAFTIPYNPQPRPTATACISQFSHCAQIRPAYVVSKDYTFKFPDWPGRFRHDADELNGQRNQYEVMDYPGRFKDEQHGKDFTRYQLEGWRNDTEIAAGNSNSAKLWPGTRFTLTDHPADDLNRDWQVVASELHGEQPQAVPGSNASGTTLTNAFQAIPANKTWRPTPLPKPKVDGPQPAIVTGPEGEEIFCDEYGRVRVKFLWDRYHAADQDSSCWIQVSQPWAGAGFGHLAIPRVGQEVIVDFLNGDPDQPIIMGRAYNFNNYTPGSLPGTKTQMTIRSQTYKGEGFNELRFEDAAGREEVYVHAEKDMNHVINNDRTSLTKRHSVDKVQGNSAVLTNRNRIIHTAGTQDLHVGGDYILSVGSGFTDGLKMMSLTSDDDNVGNVLKHLTFSVASHGLVSGMGNMTTYVQGSRIEHINLTDTSFSLGSKAISAGEMVTINAGTLLNLVAGGNSKDVCGGVKFFQATEGIELHVGKSFISLNKNGQVILKGNNIIIEGDNEVLIKSNSVKIEGGSI
ncbi:type VI secretion system tip protein VgrG [Salmonella enterica]|nr:type VI secretion system tip protein VgrG [Salmonella enterica]EFP4634475.1 type VI secretion system tip protein VgrG [Salmonella enterica]EFS0362935.1 type VI secretion system tip protein VgrG [Salmonella enterica]EGK1505245.1 type VI secretion system tip protein VgrG [Salmonella enterica]